MNKHQDEQCIFCKLANGQIPTNSIYEDEDFNVILDQEPAAKGHCIILPKNHAANLFELSKEDSAKIMQVAKTCASALKNALHCPGINLLQNNGEAAGQTVFHFHMHLIPRYTEDTVTIQWDKKEAPTASMVEEIKKGFDI